MEGIKCEDVLRGLMEDDFFYKGERFEGWVKWKKLVM